jgi:hypothetical protein
MPRRCLQQKKRRDFTALSDDLLLHIYSFNFPIASVHAREQIQQFIESWRNSVSSFSTINKISHRVISTEAQIHILDQREVSSKINLLNGFEKIERPLLRIATKLFYSTWIDLLKFPIYWPMQIYKSWGLPAHVLKQITFQHLIFNGKPFYGILRHDLIIALSNLLGPVPPRRLKTLRA